MKDAVGYWDPPTKPLLSKEVIKKFSDEIKGTYDGMILESMAQKARQEFWGDKKTYPNNNPKEAMGAKKAPLHLVPPALMIGAAEAMADGARKYGPYNFRDSKIAASVYMGAIERHLFSWWDGEDLTRDSKIHHLKAIAADVGLMLDAMAKGTFDDDRPTTGGAANLLQEWDDKND